MEGGRLKGDAFPIAQIVITEELLELSSFKAGRRQSYPHLANNSFRF
jgi:hypothetical protein